MDRDDKTLEAIKRCTINTNMLHVNNGIKLMSQNYTGADYEGLDGKRNTFMHAVLWYLARCKSYSQGIKGSMTALIFIDDGAFAIDCLL